mmetsp:Transcript_41548/g.96291  ORF Transcript_41548/g.96291 Transcript_41548/m.96291 type:complete len:228 (+) Transcript_41548:183-866(+)
MLHHDDHVELQDRLQAVCDDDDGRPGEGRLDRRLDQLLRVGVQRRGGFIQKDQGRLADDCPCEAEQLPLTEAHVAPVHCNRCEDAILHAFHCVLELYHAQALPDFFITVQAEGVEIFAHRALHEHRVLRNEANGTPQGLQPNVLSVDAVEADSARARLQDAQQAEQQCGLAAACGAHDAGLAPGLNDDADVLKDVPGDVAIARAQVFNDNLTAVGKPPTLHLQHHLL